VSQFDHLEDPLGPPSRDAFGTVLARARRRRLLRRATAAGVTVVAVVAIAVSASAQIGSDKVHVVSPSTSPAPVTSVPPSTAATTTTTTVPATTTSTAPAPTTTTPTTTTPPSNAPTQSPTDPGATWAASRLTITPQSLGRVRVGMTLNRAQVAAGMTFDGSGDGTFYPTALPRGISMFVTLTGQKTVRCVAAQTDQPPPKTVVTPEGFVLGDSVQKLLAVYGNRATFIPQPAGGGYNPVPGYVVHEGDGDLAFQLDASKNRISGILGGARGLQPSNDCVV
jgi:hypothetical protein